MLEFYVLIIEEDGERRKFKNLYDFYEKKIYYIANEILCDQGLTEDAMQETFIYLALNIQKIEENVYSARTRNYVYLVAKHKAIDIYRKRKNEIPMLDVEIANLVSYEHVEQLIIKNHELEKALRAILALPDIYRDFLELSIVYELSVKEIAAISNLKCETVKKRIQRGKELLKRAYNNE